MSKNSKDWISLSGLGWGLKLTPNPCYVPMRMSPRSIPVHVWSLQLDTHSVTQTCKYTLLPNSVNCGIPGIDLIILTFEVVYGVIVGNV
jgi:hypothetical protein